MKKISIIIPMYNEESIVKECYERIKNVFENIEKYEYEMIFIDDGSTDKTLEILNTIANTNNQVKIISFSRNFGHQAAITAGIKYVTGEACIIIDGDMQDPPEVIPEMIKLWEEGNEVIYGKRKKREGESIFKLLSAKMFYDILNNLSDIEIPKDTGDFRLVDKKVIDVINILPEHNKFLRGLFSWVGFKQISFEYDRGKRKKGKTKYNLRQMSSLALDGVFSFNSKPLKFVGALGIILIIVSICMFIYLFLVHLLKFKFVGFGVGYAFITFVSGIQLFSIWMLAEYVVRIYDETRKRPEYIVDRLINLEKYEK